MRWIDTDTSGRIHFTAVFRWVEVAEIELFRDAGIMADRDRFPRRHVEAEYLVALQFDDEVELELMVERIGRSSITFGWHADVGGQTAVHGRQTVVYVDRNGRSTPLPDEVRRQLDA